MANGHTVKQLGWRQGTFLPPDEVRNLAKAQGLEDATHAVVLSQDCDVVHEDLKVEPYAEILFLLPVEKPDPGLKDGKSSRRFHLEATQNGQPLYFQTQPWHRIQIPRVRLAEIAPDNTIVMEPNVLRTLTEWVAERYTRTAFPDAFVTRINAVDKDLKKLLKKHSGLFWRLFVRVEPQTELNEGDDYELSLLCVVPHDVWDDEAEQKQAREIAEKLNKELTSKKCSGIKLVAFDVGSDDELPLSTLSYYRTWDIFNYLTHRDRLDSKVD